MEKFDINFDLIRFLNKHNIIATSIAAIISHRINEVTSSFVDYLIIPVINRDADKDGTRDIKKLEDTTLHIAGIKFEIGKVVLSIVKFIIVTFSVFLISKLVKLITNYR